MKTSNREKIRKDILDLILDESGKLIHFCLKRSWFVNKNSENIYNNVFLLTNFLDDYNVTLRERVFYIEKNLDTVQVCDFCKKEKLTETKNKISNSNKGKYSNLFRSAKQFL